MNSVLRSLRTGLNRSRRTAIVSAMRPSFLTRACLALIALAIIALPINGKHLHLCFDGGEPPVSVHLQLDDASEPCQLGVDKVHRDADISLTGTVLAKKMDGALAASPLLVAYFVSWLSVPAPAPVSRDESAILIANLTPYRLPPLRGPPA